uniref:Uncharacterized protein n=1 Tax=Anguilla anguilla TaxID=7936 RepID=A0A0E9QYR3_ANGAN
MDNVIYDEDEEAAKAFLRKLLLLAQEKLDNPEKPCNPEKAGESRNSQSCTT